MSGMAAEHGAINLSQGYPDYSSDPKLFELVKKYMDAGRNQYALMSGSAELRQAVAEKVMVCYGRPIDTDGEICITAGATQAVFTAIQALAHPGDEVIMFDPAFDIYAPAISLSGAKPVRIPLEIPSFRIDWGRVRDNINDRTRIIIINTPHNPTGTILGRKDMEELQAVCSRHDLYVISDEVYEHLVFDGQRHESALLYDGLYERCIAAYSFGKTFHNTGWKVGYAVAPKALMDEFKKIHQFVVFSVNHPVQPALADYMQDPQTYLGLPEFYQRKRNAFLEHLRGSKFTFHPAAGTYFQLLDYSGISDKSDMDFVRELVEDHGIAAIPLSPFYEQPPGSRLLRFCFAKSNDILEKAADRLCRI